MTRAGLLTLICLAVALGGCASSLTTSGSPSASDVMASPAGTTSAPLPPNVFAPEPNHDFGTGGP